MKRFLVLSGLGLLLLSLILGGTSIYQGYKAKELRKTLDTRLTSFNYAKGLAKSVLGLLDIDGEEDFLNKKEKYREILTEEVWNEYFSNPEYYEDKNGFSLKDISLTGEILDNDNFIFKVEVEVDDGVSVSLVTYLVYISNNLIYKIESLG